MIVFLLFGLALLTLAQTIALHRFIQATGAVLALLCLQLRAQRTARRRRRARKARLRQRSYRWRDDFLIAREDRRIRTQEAHHGPLPVRT
jgi:hypothetical protein